MNCISNAIKRYVKDNDGSIPQLAADLGVAESAVRFWQYGERDPDLGRIPALARALKLNPADLVKQYIRERFPEVAEVLEFAEQTPRSEAAEIHPLFGRLQFLDPADAAMVADLVHRLADYRRDVDNLQKIVDQCEESD